MDEDGQGVFISGSCVGLVVEAAKEGLAGISALRVRAARSTSPALAFHVLFLNFGIEMQQQKVISVDCRPMIQLLQLS